MQLQRTSPGSTAVTMATLNLWNWFDTVNDPRTQDMVFSREQYEGIITKGWCLTWKTSSTALTHGQDIRATKRYGP